MQALRGFLGVKSSSDFHDHGLRLLVPDRSSSEESHGRWNFDIVFVHGLTGTWDRTWTGQTTDGRDVLWPKELLVERFPTARIFSFGYDANAFNLAHRVSTQSVRQHANDLLIELESFRRDTGTQNCRIVHAVHSLGGLVVQKMLSLSKNSHESHYQGIEAFTLGVVFFGTPMLGADLAAWASIGAALSSVLKQTNRDIVGILEPSSSMTESIRFDFANLVAIRSHTDNPMKIACFFECLTMPGYGKVVVDHRSATWPPHYEKGIQADHINMTKFPSTQARGYKDFIGEVGRWIDEISGERRQPSDLLYRLDFAERTARQQQIDNTHVLESTLDWIWRKDYESHSSFAQWLLNDQAVFWIQGKPGSGKSTLMSYLEKATRSWQDHSSSKYRWSTVRFFFDFRAHDGLANNLNGFLRSLLLQILQQSPSSESGLRHLEEEFGDSSTWESSTLKKAFIHVLLQHSVNLCVLVDGLDEFSGNLREMLTLFQNLPTKTNTGRFVKICLASRPHPIISSTFGRQPGLEMQAHNANAIRQYAFTTLKEYGVAVYDEPLLKQLSAYIARKAEGMFLWARFAIMEIDDSDAKGEYNREMNQRLEALPSDLEELYMHIFERLNTRDREEAQLMFQLVCFVPKNISRLGFFDCIKLRQLEEAINVTQGSFPGPAQDNSSEGLETFRRRLRAKSGGLLEEVTSHPYLYGGHHIVQPERLKEDGQEVLKKHGGFIKLIHRTAESFLERKGWFLGLKSLQIGSPHALWLHVCCKIIQSSLESQELQLRDVKTTRLKPDESNQYSLFEYASRNLFIHARLLERQCHESSLPFLEIVSATLWRHLRAQYRLSHLRHRIHQNHVDWHAVDEVSDKQPWQIIVEQGLPLSLKDAVRRGLYTPSSHGQDLSLALLKIQLFDDLSFRAPQAVRQLIPSLIELGAVVRRWHISASIDYGDSESLGLLLASRPKGRIRFRGDTLYVREGPLELNSEEAQARYTLNEDSIGILWELVRICPYDNGFQAILVMLLERGESLDELCGPGGTALHRCIIKSSWHGLRDVRLVLKLGADPNVSGPRGTPLQLAWRMFRSPSAGRKEQAWFQEVMKLLLQFGADSSWVEPNGITIDRHTIDAWCAMSPEELEAQLDDHEHNHPYCISDWDTYEFALYRPASKSDKASAHRRI